MGEGLGDALVGEAVAVGGQDGPGDLCAGADEGEMIGLVDLGKGDVGADVLDGAAEDGADAGCYGEIPAWLDAVFFWASC